LVLARPRLVRVAEFHVDGVMRWEASRLACLHNAVKKSLLVPLDDKMVAVAATGERSVPWREAGADMGRVLLAANVDEGPEDEVFVGWRMGTNLTLSVKNQSMHQVTLKTFRAAGAAWVSGSSVQPDSTFDGCVQGALDRSEQRRVLAIINTGYALKPRGVICYDYQTEAELWRYATAGGPWDMAVADLDGDGNQEVVVITGAPSNGNWEWDGTDDDHAAVYCLEAEGVLRWCYQFHGDFVVIRLNMGDVDGDGRPEVVVQVGCSEHLWLRQNAPVAGQLLVWDADGVEKHRLPLSAWVQDSRLADLDGDGHPEVLAFDGHGRLEVLDLGRRRVTTAAVVPNRYDFVHGYIVGVVDLDRDGRKEIVLQASQVRRWAPANEGHPLGERQPSTGYDNAVIVLDDRLRERARYVVAPEWTLFNAWHVEVGDVLGDARPEIVPLAQKAEVLEFRRR
jgi:hypothetical protein